MIKNTVIDRCLKSDFKAIEQKSEKRFILRWGKKDEVERVFARNELTGEPEFTGEVKETDWCTYETGIYEGTLTPYKIDEGIAGKTRFFSVAEYKEICDGIGLEEERQVSILKKKLKEEIGRYDKSEAVEDFTIGGIHLWLGYNLRNKVRENLETAQMKGETDVVLRYNRMEFPMTVETGWQLYYAVLDYACATWDVTESHLASAESLETVEEILSYDYTKNYPEKLSL